MSPWKRRKTIRRSRGVRARKPPARSTRYSLAAIASLSPVAGLLSGALALAYGYGMWRLGLRIAVDRVRWRLPELLDAISVRQAA